MKNIKQLSDSELDEIISGSVDGVYPTSQEVSMATELKTRRELPKADGQEPDYIRYSCGCCGYESLSSFSFCLKCNFDNIEEMPLFVHAMPSIPAAEPDYFASLVAAARVRADKVMRKFPQPNYVLNKVAEESGEVIKAVIHYTEGREAWVNVEGELIDNLAMLIRLVTEGDQVIGFTPPAVFRSEMAGIANGENHEKPSA